MHALVRATSSGALNNIGHLRRRVHVHWADLTDRHSVDRVVAELAKAPDAPYVLLHLERTGPCGRKLGATIRDYHGQYRRHTQPPQSVVSGGVELEKFDTAGTLRNMGIPANQFAINTTGMPAMAASPSFTNGRL